MKVRFIHIAPLLFVASACIETFDPKISNAVTVGTLVVEGRITDQEGPYFVRLSSSKPIGLDTTFAVSGAIVSIEEEGGTSTSLAEVRQGFYVTNPADLMGEVGKRYRLSVVLPDDTQYQSSWELLRETPEIVDVRFEPAVVETQIETLFGAQLYLDTEATKDASFFKWEIFETWKYKVPFASDSIYVALGKGAPKPLEDIHETCWKRNRGSKIMIRSIGDLSAPSIINHPLDFISSDSARLNIRHSTLIEQYAVGAQEYDFWQSMKNINEDVGKLFDKQPFEVTGNVKNVTDENEPVLGYFSAYSVQSIRIYMNRTDFPENHLPKPTFFTSLTPFVPDPIEYDCQLYYHPVPPMTTPESWDINLAILMDGNIRMFYKEDYWFSTPVCGDCEVYGGTTIQPDFWEE